MRGNSVVSTVLHENKLIELITSVNGVFQIVSPNPKSNSSKNLGEDQILFGSPVKAMHTLLRKMHIYT